MLILNSSYIAQTAKKVMDDLKKITPTLLMTVLCPPLFKIKMFAKIL